MGRALWHKTKAEDGSNTEYSFYFVLLSENRERGRRGKEEKKYFRGSGKQQFSELYSGLGAGICAFLRVVEFVVVE